MIDVSALEALGLTLLIECSSRSSPTLHSLYVRAGLASELRSLADGILARGF